VGKNITPQYPRSVTDFGAARRRKSALLFCGAKRRKLPITTDIVPPPMSAFEALRTSSLSIVSPSRCRPRCTRLGSDPPPDTVRDYSCDHAVHEGRRQTGRRPAHAGSRLKLIDASGRSRLIRPPSSRTGENPPYGMIGRIEETSASNPDGLRILDQDGREVFFWTPGTADA